MKGTTFANVILQTLLESQDPSKLVSDVCTGSPAVDTIKDIDGYLPFLQKKGI
jgi:hypothetical protein